MEFKFGFANVEGSHEIYKALFARTPRDSQIKFNTAIWSLQRRTDGNRAQFPTKECLVELFHEQLGPFFHSLSPEWREHFVFDVITTAKRCLFDPFRVFDYDQHDQKSREVLKFLRVERKQVQWLLEHPNLRSRAEELSGWYEIEYCAHLQVFEESMDYERKKIMQTLGITEEKILKRKLERIDKMISILEIPNTPDRGGSRFRAHLLDLYRAIRPAFESLDCHKIKAWDPRLIKNRNQTDLYAFSFERFAVNLFLLLGSAKTETALLDHMKKAKADPELYPFDDRDGWYTLPWKQWLERDELRWQEERAREDAERLASRQAILERQKLEEEIYEYLTG